MNEKPQLHDTPIAADRKPYQAPRLSIYGSVQALTATGSMGGSENNAVDGMCQSDVTRMACTSDIRAKQDIVVVGRHPLGFGLYLFDYKPEFSHLPRGRQFGAMAQEVASVVPEAVSAGDDGYLRVNYAMLGIDSKLSAAH